MKVLFAFLMAVLMLPLLLVIAIALGPAILVMLFIAGFALIGVGLAWLAETARSHHARRTRVPPLGT